MKVVYWLALVGVCVMPASFLFLAILKVFVGVPWGGQQLVGFVMALIGVKAAIWIYRNLISGRGKVR